VRVRRDGWDTGTADGSHELGERSDGREREPVVVLVEHAGLVGEPEGEVGEGEALLLELAA